MGPRCVCAEVAAHQANVFLNDGLTPTGVAVDLGASAETCVAVQRITRVAVVTSFHCTCKFAKFPAVDLIVVSQFVTNTSN